MPVVRCVNTGISGLIDSDGRIESVLEKTVGEYRQRVMVAGTLRVQPQVDARQTWYDRFGDVFAWVVAAAAAGLMAWLIGRRRLCEKTRPTTSPQ